jgi:hypothetical protein
VARFRAEGDHGQTSNTYAPGPMLAPLLPPAGDRDVAGPGDTPAAQTRTPENYTKRSGGTGQKRNGDDRPRCPRCPHQEHGTTCSRCGCRDYGAYTRTREGRYELRDGRMVLVPHLR